MADVSDPPAAEGEEKLSKNELKRRAKEAEKAKLKAEKDAAKAAAKAAEPAAEKKKKDDGPVLEDDDDIDPAKFFENRLAWVNGLKSKGTNPYPHKFQTTMQLGAFHAAYSSVEPGGFADAVEGVAGAPRAAPFHWHTGRRATARDARCVGHLPARRRRCASPTSSRTVAPRARAAGRVMFKRSGGKGLVFYDV